MSDTELASSVILYKPATIARKICFKLKTYTQGKFNGVSSSSRNSQLAKFHVQMQVAPQSGGLSMTETDSCFTMAAWRMEEFPKDIHLYTQKGNPEVFDRSGVILVGRRRSFLSVAWPTGV